MVYKLWTTIQHGSTRRNIESNEDIFYTARMSVTYQPKKRKRAKTHGFLARKKTANGAKVIKRRIQKGRKRVAV